VRALDAFEGSLDVCERHADRLRWAMGELSRHFPLSPSELGELTDVELAIIDQFIVRFSKLQDAMGAKLFPNVLALTQEHGDLPTFIDKLNKLEKIGAIESASAWLRLREMRNQFAHDYPDDPEIQASLLNKAYAMADDLLGCLAHVKDFSAPYPPS